MNDGLLILKSYVEISSYRTKTIKSIGETVKIPSKIAKDTGIRINHISNVLKQLKEHELVECINEEAKKGRLYRLTEKGLKINEMINNIGDIL